MAMTPPTIPHAASMASLHLGQDSRNHQTHGFFPVPQERPNKHHPVPMARSGSLAQLPVTMQPLATTDHQFEPARQQQVASSRKEYDQTRVRQQWRKILPALVRISKEDAHRQQHNQVLKPASQGSSRQSISPYGRGRSDDAGSVNSVPCLDHSEDHVWAMA